MILVLKNSHWQRQNCFRFKENIRSKHDQVSDVEHERLSKHGKGINLNEIV